MREVIPPEAKLLPPQAERVFKGEIYDVYQWQQKLFDGSHATFEMIKRPDTVKVIAVKDDKIVILEEEQPFHGKFFDIPGGRHDHEEETELQAIQRELREETGLSFKNWHLLRAIQPQSKTDHLAYLFLAHEFDSQTEPKPDGGEKITVHLKSLDEVKNMLGKPTTRYLPKEILSSVGTIDELLALPEYSASSN